VLDVRLHELVDRQLRLLEPGECIALGGVIEVVVGQRAQLAARAQPLELEADLRYPGAPPSRDAAGGQTVRRLLDAYGRNPAFCARAAAPTVRRWMEAYFGEPVLMSRAPDGAPSAPRSRAPAPR